MGRYLRNLRNRVAGENPGGPAACQDEDIDPLDVPVQGDETAEIFSPAWLGTGEETEQA